MISIRFIRTHFRYLVLVFLCSATLVTSADNDKAFFWKVSSATGHLYVLGSIHLADASFYPLRSTISDAYKQADALVVEANLLAIDGKTIQKMHELSLYPTGESLADHIDTASLVKLEQFAERFNLPVTSLLQQRAGMLMMTLQQLLYQDLALNPQYGIDMHFLLQAKVDNKPIKEFESVLQQVEMIINLGTEQQIVDLALADLSQQRQEVLQTVEYWKEGNDVAFQKLLLDQPLADDPTLEPLLDKLFYQRNRVMAERMESWLKNNRTQFVVVGAGHLVGEKGIIALLSQQGFTVDRL